MDVGCLLIIWLVLIRLGNIEFVSDIPSKGPKVVAVNLEMKRS